MRVAFVDLLFTWPPHGGACTDVYQVAAGLRRLGHDVRLFAAACEGAWERGTFQPEELPFASTRLEFGARDFNRREVPARFRRAVDEWRPDAVVLADAFFLKPYLAQALAHYPLVGRYYAYEVACPRDFRLFKDGAPCPNNYLRTPDVCRRCTLKAMAPEIRRWQLQPWAHEYVAARAFLPGYHRRLAESLAALDAVVVYNDLQRSQLEGFHGNVRVVPGGVDTAQFAYSPPEAHERKAVLMVGRAEDPAKGYAVLREAAERLARTRADFEVWVTRSDGPPEPPYVKSTGWLDRAGLADLYRRADVAVFPSVWEEPFGLVAVEAMAVGRPVCASRVGGLGDIVVDGETGFLHERGDAAALAEHLGRLLDDAELRRRMGEAGRRRAEDVYDWDRIVERHYAPLLEEVARGK